MYCRPCRRRHHRAGRVGVPHRPHRLHKMTAMAELSFSVDGAALKLLLLGGQKSGKSRQAELLAYQWLQQGTDYTASLIATGTAYDDEMKARIARHQTDRAARVPQLATVDPQPRCFSPTQSMTRADTALMPKPAERPWTKRACHVTA